jgi:hypothetical protein
MQLTFSEQKVQDPKRDVWEITLVRPLATPPHEYLDRLHRAEIRAFFKSLSPQQKERLATLLEYGSVHQNSRALALAVRMWRKQHDIADAR